MRYEEFTEKTSIQRKIEQIIQVNREETGIKTKEEDQKMDENEVFWKRFFLRSDIICTVYVSASLLLNTQRNLFLDVIPLFYFESF